jgi:hypothetical protein
MQRQTLKEFVDANCIPIDREIFLMMWNVIEGDEWIFLDRKFIKSALTMDISKDAVNRFYLRTLVTYVENLDYKNIEYPSIGKHPPNTKFYSVTRRTFVKLLCTAKTPRVNRCLDYLYEIQNLMVQYYKSQYDDYKSAVNEMMSAPAIVSHTRLQAIIELDRSMVARNNIGLVYFIHEEGDLNFFKVGCTANLKVRISNLQTGSRRILKCYNMLSPSIRGSSKQFCMPAFLITWSMVNGLILIHPLLMNYVKNYWDDFCFLGLVHMNHIFDTMTETVPLNESIESR